MAAFYGFRKWVVPSRGTTIGDPVVLIVCEDITSQKQADELMRIQTEVLEMTAKGVEMAETLNTLCCFVERMVPDAIVPSC